MQCGGVRSGFTGRGEVGGIARGVDEAGELLVEVDGAIERS